MRIKKIFTTILITLFVFPILIYGAYWFHHKNHWKDKQVGFDYSLIKVNNKAWGYEIFSGAKLIIKQQQIPCFEGEKQFKSKEDAERVAKLVVNKLRHNQFPAVSKEELYKLKIDTSK
jgi:hypothetical protein